MLLWQLLCHVCARGWINLIYYIWQYSIFFSSWRINGPSAGILMNSFLFLFFNLSLLYFVQVSWKAINWFHFTVWNWVFNLLQVPGILFTPICPHSLSFRPLIFPEHVTLRVQVPFNSRSPAWASFDGKDRKQLAPGDALVCSMAPWPVPTACLDDSTNDFLRSIHEGLHWNLRKTQSFDGPRETWLPS